MTVIAPPHKGHSLELIQAATGKAKLKRHHLARCLLPAKIVDAGGNLIATRPVAYAPPSP